MTNKTALCIEAVVICNQLNAIRAAIVEPENEQKKRDAMQALTNRLIEIEGEINAINQKRH